ncbi:hypothetical protein M413DRAFT_118065 [Hebeloma cylindrosporum]|uniref:DUF6593 domain-containing protein n=1 Tax=Hebeloma cylindrosporum TaxID=76867 RepID=A0A0C3D0C4_HEBCY|nr:hypothetical protein M413DRAFT_118065 [Hebeloma cylindrosporum h7]
MSVMLLTSGMISANLKLCCYCIRRSCIGHPDDRTIAVQKATASAEINVTLLSSTTTMQEPTLQLFLSMSGRPWDTVYRTADGQAVYKAEFAMPEKRDIKIARIIPTIVDGQGSKDTFGHVARVECHMRRAVRIRMGDLDVATSEYLKPDKSGFWSSLSNRVFTGPDGREYVWSAGKKSTKLFLKDSERTLVARYHHPTLGLIGEARPAMLEIFGAGKAMSDIIVVTSICMEIMLVGDIV